MQHTGLGRTLKRHQRAWAAAHGLRCVTWTFDPLVRRNAWFNLGVLGARVHEYLVDFYGPIGDSINAGDESDRLLVVWPVADEPSEPATDETSTVATPEDIVVLRRTAPDEAMRLAAPAAPRPRRAPRRRRPRRRVQPRRRVPGGRGTP